MLGGINGFEYDYLSRINLVKDKKGEMLADSPQYFKQLDEQLRSVTGCTYDQSGHAERKTHSSATST